MVPVEMRARCDERGIACLLVEAEDERLRLVHIRGSPFGVRLGALLQSRGSGVRNRVEVVVR